MFSLKKDLSLAETLQVSLQEEEGYYKNRMEEVTKQLREKFNIKIGFLKRRFIIIELMRLFFDVTKEEVKEKQTIEIFNIFSLFISAADYVNENGKNGSRNICRKHIKK